MHQFLKIMLISCLLQLSPFSLYAERKDRSPHTEELRQLERSFSKGGVGRKYLKDEKQLYGGKWFVAGTNFARLFIHQAGHKVLAEWAFSLTPGFILLHSKSSRDKEFIQLEMAFRDESFNNFSVRILVPHPKYAKMAEMLLIEPFARQVPPRLRITDRRIVPLRDNKWILSTHYDGGCSMIFSLARSATVLVFANKCSEQDRELMIKLAEKVEVQRLNNKLQS